MAGWLMADGNGRRLMRWTLHQPSAIAISHQPSAMTALSEGHALRLRPRRRHDERDDEHERDEAAHRLRVGEAFAEVRLDVRDARREHHAELIREAGEEAAQMVR